MPRVNRLVVALQTYNVVSAPRGQAVYAPLWNVVVRDKGAFDGVTDRASAGAAAVPVPAFGLASGTSGRVQ